MEERIRERKGGREKGHLMDGRRGQIREAADEKQNPSEENRSRGHGGNGDN